MHEKTHLTRIVLTLAITISLNAGAAPTTEPDLRLAAIEREVRDHVQQLWGPDSAAIFRQKGWEQALIKCHQEVYGVMPHANSAIGPEPVDEQARIVWLGKLSSLIGVELWGSDNPATPEPEGWVKRQRLLP